MKKTIAILLLAAMSISVAACGSTKTSESETQQPQSTAVSEPETETVKGVDLNTEDIAGNPVTNDVLQDAKVVLINLWEPWCGPCVMEMPDLQKLYDDYKDQGLLVIGVYADFEMQEDAESVVSENNINYPILKCNDYLETLQQDYIPATYIADGDGNLLTDEPIVGSQSYEEWEEIIKEYLD